MVMSRKISIPLISYFTIFLLSISIVALLVQRNQLQWSYLDAQLELATFPKIPADFRRSRRILSNLEHMIFVGGIPRSGTTLMRVILDAHSDVRCGGETMMIPSFLNWQDGWRFSEWTKNAGITNQILDDAISAFLTEIIGKHGAEAKRLCNKDPYTALKIPTLVRLFPMSQHIVMVRDPRAIIHSIIERKVPVNGYNTTDPEQMFRTWNREIRQMVFPCINLLGRCILVHYERLVQRPKEELTRILSFLELDFEDALLHHEELIGSRIQISEDEFSASQVKEGLYQKALSAWFDCFDEKLMRSLDEVAPMMSMLGYDPYDYKPTYSQFNDPNFLSPLSE